jgi:thioester reductase-like protein
LLTGATGMLGQYLLQGLLREGRPVVVLARASNRGSAAERIAELVAGWNEGSPRKLPTPRVLAGELGPDGLGLTGVERRWLGQHCGTLIHAAASLSFRETGDGEPWRTNVEGTKSLLALCRQVGVSEWHQVSTAFVAGRRAGIIPEEGPEGRPLFHNPYEESKYEAEMLVRRTPGIRTTMHRPSVIVGDSRTGHTSSFTGLYRFLELGARLAAMNGGAGKRSLPLRLPLTGGETWDLVPVDWVARAIAELVDRPTCHGRNFHLVSASPVPTRLIRDVAAEVLQLPGVEFVGAGGGERPGRLEQLFLDGIREYWPYLRGNPVFACDNTRAALPNLPPPVVDRPVLERLILFAATNRWGRTPSIRAATVREQRAGPAPLRSGLGNPQEYIEHVFPRQAARSRLARAVGLDLTVGIDLRGPGGGQWSCKWRRGELVYAKRGLEEGTAVTYHTDTATFQAVVNGLQTPQEAFFEGRIAITGDLETALKLAALFAQFLAENPAARRHRTEVMDSTAFPG